MDNLTYTYTARTNRLASVADAVTTDLDWDARPTSFVYNRVGSVTWTTEELTPTTYRETEIQVYDERQLPEELRIRLIATPGGAYDSTMVSYRYDTNGQRIRKQIRATEHGPDVVYERYVRDGMRLIGVFDENDELKSWNIGGAAGLVGRADPATLGFTRRYYVSDHLGSIRAVVDQAGTVVEGRDYYPYGLTMPGRFYVQADTTREAFTGHELDRETGDYYAGARYYGPALARWFVPDPMAEAYPGWSPYNYTMGNPVMLVDPDGMEADDDVDQLSAPRSTESFYTVQGAYIRSNTILVDRINIADFSITEYREYATADPFLQVIEQSGSSSHISEFSFSQLAYLPVEGGGFTGSFNVIGAVAVQALNEESATIFISASGMSGSESRHAIDWYGYVTIFDGTTIPLNKPTSPSIVNATRSHIGSATFTVPRSALGTLDITIGYIYSDFTGKSLPVPSTTTRTIGLPPIISNNP